MRSPTSSQMRPGHSTSPHNKNGPPSSISPTPLTQSPRYRASPDPADSSGGPQHSSRRLVWGEWPGSEGMPEKADVSQPEQLRRALTAGGSAGHGGNGVNASFLCFQNTLEYKTLVLYMLRSKKGNHCFQQSFYKDMHQVQV